MLGAFMMFGVRLSLLLISQSHFLGGEAECKEPCPHVAKYPLTIIGGIRCHDFNLPHTHTHTHTHTHGYPMVSKGRDWFQDLCGCQCVQSID
jgi:hypothetical protein